MNYEELLASRGDGKLNRSRQPIGEYYRLKSDGKYRGRVDIRPELNSSIAFSEALKTECEANRRLSNPHQLHFEAVVEHGDVTHLDLEAGSYQSFEQLLLDTPAVVAEKDFTDRTFEALVEAAAYLHGKGVWHVCFSPKTVFVRKGDHALMLLSHGSFYLSVCDQQELYGDDARYVAPEVMSHGAVDGRCDVYSIGQFMNSLFEHVPIPLEYRKALRKATAEQPEKRFARPEDFLKAVRKCRGTIRSALALAVSVVVALVCLGLYFDMVPEVTQVEYVKPASDQHDVVLPDEDGMSPEDMGLSATDTLTAEELRGYQATAEAIFRKRFTKEADRILSKIYDTKYMSNSEKQFRAQSQTVIKELMDVQQQLGEEASLTPERAQLIASEIIDHISDQKKKEWGTTSKNGIQK